jgi:hypothetical protein
MLRSAAGKAAWVGRTAAMVFGLALVLALVLGVATMALAAVPGDPFRLGKVNSIDRLSTLVGTATSPILKVENKGTGTALHLKVQDGKPPLAVTSKGRVPRLNSDMVDGKHAGAFLPKGATAADSEKLGGKDASEFTSYKRTVVASPVGSATENGSALRNALQGITDASATKPYLLYIEAGTYDLGNGFLQMKQYVDIEGAGELRTIITSTVAGCEAGTVNGANNAELRFLTVRNTGTLCAYGIYNNGTSPRLTNVTVESESRAVGNYDASPTMTNVTATATASTVVVNNISSPTIRNSRFSGSTYSLLQNGGTSKVAGTQLVGTVVRFHGTLQCFNNYNENMQPVTCP